MNKSSKSVVEAFSGRPLKLTIDRAAFQHNIKVVEQIAPDSKPLIVIKANAYGHGLLEMAKLAGEYDLAVAVPEEASCLVSSGIQNRIWVLEGPFSTSCLALSAKASIVWVIHSLWQLDLIASLKANVALHVCLKLDSGMHRLGLTEQEFIQAAKRVQSSDRLELVSSMSHFSSSEGGSSHPVQTQIDSFETALEAANLSHLPKSLANSGAILFCPQSHLDYVRPGIMLYGGMPSPDQSAKEFGLKSVMSFQSAIISVCNVPKGEGVGYGSRWIAPKDSIIATIAGGYGDGYPRHAINGTPVGVFVKNKAIMKVAPLVGSVSMDMLSIDISDIADEGVDVGSMVEFWGAHISVDDVARMSNTISYTLLCGVTARVPRSGH